MGESETFLIYLKLLRNLLSSFFTYIHIIYYWQTIGNRNFHSRLHCFICVDGIWITLRILTFVLWKLWVFLPLPLHGLNFWEQLSQQIEQNIQRVPIYPLPHIPVVSLTINILHCRDTFVIIDKPMLTCYYHPKSILYIIRIPPSCCVFYGF